MKHVGTFSFHNFFTSTESFHVCFRLKLINVCQIKLLDPERNMKMLLKSPTRNMYIYIFLFAFEEICGLPLVSDEMEFRSLLPGQGRTEYAVFKRNSLRALFLAIPSSSGWESRQSIVTSCERRSRFYRR